MQADGVEILIKSLWIVWISFSYQRWELNDTWSWQLCYCWQSFGRIPKWTQAIITVISTLASLQFSMIFESTFVFSVKLVQKQVTGKLCAIHSFFFSFGNKFIQFNVQYSQFHEITMNKIQQINWFFFSQRLHLVRVHRPRAHLHHHRRPNLRNHRKRLQNIQNILNTRKRRKESMKYISKVEKTVNEPVVA